MTNEDKLKNLQDTLEDALACLIYARHQAEGLELKGIYGELFDESVMVGRTISTIRFAREQHG